MESKEEREAKKSGVSEISRDIGMMVKDSKDRGSKGQVEGRKQKSLGAQK